MRRTRFCGTRILARVPYNGGAIAAVRPVRGRSPALTDDVSRGLSAVPVRALSLLAPMRRIPRKDNSERRNDPVT
jgi:hypothetical protein